MEVLEINGYQTQQIQEELDYIIKLVTGKKNYLEIGTYGGGTFYSLSKVIKGKHISIDLGTVENKDDIDKSLKKDIKNCLLITGDSHSIDVENQVKEYLKGETIDVLFIDGDHSYKGVREDYLIYKKYVSEGGLIIFHDIVKSEFHIKNGCEVYKLWDELKGEKDSINTS